MEAKDIVEELKALTRVLASSGTLLNRSLADQSQNAMVTSIVQQISSLRSLDVAGAANINEAIASSTMSEPMKAQLAEAVTRRALTGQTSTTIHRPCQGLKNPCAYFTVEDWQCFEDPNIGLNSKILRMVDRMVRLGLTNPSERTTHARYRAYAKCFG